jgi:tetratricopeptide (TPR) repeat protein
MSWALVVSALMAGCAHGTAVAVNPTPPGPGPDDEPTEEMRRGWEHASATFARLDQGEWDGAACREGLAAVEEVNILARGRSARAVYMMGLVSTRCGNADGARALYERALELDADLCEARVALGLRELDAGHRDRARTALEEAVRRDSLCASGYVNLAAMQADEPSEREAALANLRRALAIEADNLAALNQMALVYLAQADEQPQLLELAEVVLRQAQLVDATYAPLYNTWGLIDVEQEDITGAAAKFARAMELDPSLFSAHMNFGQITLSQRAYGDAARAFTRARELSPHSYDAAIGLGVAMRGLRDPEGAERMYRAALELDGDRPEAYFDLAVLYHEHREGTQAQLTEALSMLERFVQSARGDERFEPTVADVVRWCDDAPAGRRRRAAQACRPGRAQQIEQALGFMTNRQPQRPAWTR